MGKMQMSNEYANLSERQLFEGLSSAAENVYIFKTNIQASYAKWSENAVNYFGFPKDYENDFTKIWMEHIHPDDCEGYGKDLAAVLSGQKESHHYQYRAKNAEGEYVWLECVGSIIRDQNKNPEFFVGILTRLDAYNKYDTITKCLSMREFYTSSFEGSYTLLLIGMDGFRKVLDSIGFAECNKVLYHLADILRKYVSIDRLFRMPGDEFLVVLPECTEKEVEKLFVQIQEEFQNTCFTNERVPSIGFSGGCTWMTRENENRELLISKLEQALENSKQNHIGGLSFYSDVLGETLSRNRRIRYSLSKSIKNNFEGFYVVYQPILETNGHIFGGVEALLRFKDEELGNISPLEFVPILERSGEIEEVGKWVAYQAISQKKQWQKRYPGLFVGFNVSLKQLHTTSFAKYVTDLVNELHLNPSEVTIELTESCGISDLAKLKESLLIIKEKGIPIFLDDFGMEHSSYTLIQELPVAGVKIDQSFIRAISGSGDEGKDFINKTIVSNISCMCRQLGMKVVAEGIEEEKIDTILSDMDIDLLQGYYYSKPIMAEEIEKKYK